jgi:hypothetical protein
VVSGSGDRLRRLPIVVAPARHELVSSYVGRLARLHGLSFGDLWSPFRAAGGDGPACLARLVGLTGLSAESLAAALPELREPAPDWRLFRHVAQRGCWRCDVRHEGGAVVRVLVHHQFVCRRHRVWIGLPGPSMSTDLTALPEVVHAQRRHERLVQRYGWRAAYDAVQHGLRMCAMIWRGVPDSRAAGAWLRWSRRAAVLMPAQRVESEFAVSRLFAVIYPDAVAVAPLLASPVWRRWASRDFDDVRRTRFDREISARFGLDYRATTRTDRRPLAVWARFAAARMPAEPPFTLPLLSAVPTQWVLQPKVSAHRRVALQTFLAEGSGGRVLMADRNLAWTRTS